MEWLFILKPSLCIGRAALALTPKARAARPTKAVPISGTAARDKTFLDNFTGSFSIAGK
jgi:hypothetical protein